MPIVISDFEIVPEPPPETQAQSRDTAQATRLPSPYELALAIAHQLRRDDRVKAD